MQKRYYILLVSFFFVQLGAMSSEEEPKNPVKNKRTSLDEEELREIWRRLSGLPYVPDGRQKNVDKLKDRYVDTDQ